MDIVSLQSRVVWGYVGNAVAVPVIQAAGVRAWPVDSVRLAHHPGHGPTTRLVTPPAEIAALMTGAAARLDGPAALLIGYLGEAGQGQAALEIAAAQPAPWPVYLDPAFGDDAEGIYVAADIVAFYKDAVRQAAVLMPNRFELASLAGSDVTDPPGAIAAARRLMAEGPAEVLVSSVPVAGGIGTMLVTADHAWMVTAPRLNLAAKGTGDLLSAAFCANKVSGEPSVKALAAAADLARRACEDAAARGLTEMDLPGLLGSSIRGDNVLAAQPVAL